MKVKYNVYIFYWICQAHWYSWVPFALRLLPKHLTFDNLANLVPNWIALFLNFDDVYKPKSTAIFLRSFFSPLPYVIELMGKLRR
jgi:hypothetical protein